MHRFARPLLLSVILSLPLASCGQAPEEPPPPVALDPHQLLVSQLEAAASAETTPGPIAVPDGTDVWVVGLADQLAAKWNSLGLKVPQHDKDRLLKEGAGTQHLLVARITEGRLAEVSVLPPAITASPAAFGVKAGESLSITRREDPRPVLVEKAGG